MATHSSILAWKIPCKRSTAGYSPWGCKELDTTEPLHFFTHDDIDSRNNYLYSCPLLFNLYAEYIMRNAGLEEAQAEIKIARRISITSDMQMTLPLWQKVKRN